MLWRRRKRYADWRDWPAEPAATISHEDLQAKTAWGLSTPEWLALSNDERADKRLNITSGPFFDSLSR
jgi:hypothetical protein